MTAINKTARPDRSTSPSERTKAIRDAVNEIHEDGLLTDSSRTLALDLARAAKPAQATPGG